MAEVEKKKKAGKLTYAAVGIVGITVLGTLGFMIYGVVTGAKKETAKRISSQQVNPAYVPPEKVAQAIPQPKKAKETKAEVPPPPPEKKEKGEGAGKKEEKIPAGRNNREEWKIPPPSGHLQILPKPEKPKTLFSKNPFSFGFPKPSPSSGLFKRKPAEEKKIAERMKVITPRLIVAPVRKQPSAPVRTAEKPKKEKFVTVAAAGEFVPGVLSQGIRAPIGYKVPVRIKLTGAAQGVGDHSFDLSSCVVLGAGKGLDTGNSARIEVEVLKLSCQWPDGELHTVPVTGYLVDGRDGKLHLAAKLNVNTGKVALASFLQGAALGAAEAAKKAQEITQTSALNQNTSISSTYVKNEHKYVLWGGVAGAFSATEQMLKQRIAKMMSVETADREPGGKVYVVFTQDVRVPEKWLGRKESSNYQFKGLEQW